MLEYEVHYYPPKYPKALWPSRCHHHGPDRIQAAVHIVRDQRGKNRIEIDHQVCLVCGLACPATVGGNIFVDLQMLWERFGFHAELGARIIYIREKWARIATYLFDRDGWNGRHERIARLIDPRLTMKLCFNAEDNPSIMAANRHRVARVLFDPEYLRTEA